MVNAVVKHAAERALVAVGAAAAARVYHRRGILVLAYHNILADDETATGDASLHLSRTDFARQLDALAHTHEVVPLTAILDPPGTARRPRVVITFDDAYFGALRWGIAELANRGMAATIFVAPGLLGKCTWWDILADPRLRAVPQEVRDRALMQHRGDTDAILRGVPVPGQRGDPGQLRIGTEEDLVVAAQHPGITIGSHTWSHRNLCALEVNELERELQRPMDWLRARFANFVPWLSYPYGLRSAAIGQAVASVGYAGALCVDGGWMGQRPGPELFALPRYNVPSGLSLDGFRLRLGASRVG